MRTEPTPIDDYLVEVFDSPTIMAVYKDWRVDPKDLILTMAGIFRELGIFAVPPATIRLMHDNVIFQLNNSPEIQNMRRRLDQAHQMKRSNRHSE